MCPRLLVLLALALAVAHAQTNEVLVNTTYGPIIGVVEGNYRAWLGIRYTGAPVGAYRWAAPPTLAPWTTPIPTQEFGAGCPQICELPPHTCPNVTSEDCLFLNVYSPRVSALNDSLVPVMVYLAGGRFEQGTGGCDLYSGHYLTPHSNIVVVTPNYRLGALGFFYSDDVEGNFGITDQRLALQWVQANIRAFGGDPTRVTVAGQSAGAISIITHLLSPQSNGLFHQAAVMSDPYTLGFKTEDEAKAMSKKFAHDVGCDYHDLTCLRDVAIPDLLVAQKKAQSKVDLLHVLGGFMPWLPTVDGTIVPLDAWTAFSTGKYNKVPIFLGTVWEEARLFIYQAWNNTLSDVDYVGILTAVFDAKMFNVLKMYPDDHAPDTRDTLSVLGTDYIFHCPTRWFVRTITEQQPGVPVYTYMFNHSWSFAGWGPNYPDCVGHVCHGAELPFVFDAAQPFFNFTAPEAALSLELASYWGNFVNSGTPNGPLPVAPTWPPYNRTTDLTLVMSTGLSRPASTLVSALQTSTCDFWDSIGYQY